MSFKIVVRDRFNRKRNIPKCLRDIDEGDSGAKAPSNGLGETPAERRTKKVKTQPREPGGRFTTREPLEQLEGEHDFRAWDIEDPNEAARHDDDDDDGSGLDADGLDVEEEENGQISPATQVAYSKDLSKGYFTGKASSVWARETLLTAQRVAMRSAVAACASSAQPCPTCGAQCEPDKVPRCTTTIITWEQPIVVDVPLFWCSKCTAVFGVKPTQVDCLPDTKVAWDLRLRRDGNAILWWHNSVLQQYALLSYYTKHVSADGFCGAMMDAWEENGVQPPELPPRQGYSVSSDVPPPRLTHTMLRQRLRPALNAYYHMFGLTADLPETLSQWPSGSANGCPCCGDSHCSYRSPAPASTAVAAGAPTMPPAVTAAVAVAGEAPPVTAAAAAVGETPANTGTGVTATALAVADRLAVAPVVVAVAGMLPAVAMVATAAGTAAAVVVGTVAAAAAVAQKVAEAAAAASTAAAVAADAAGNDSAAAAARSAAEAAHAAGLAAAAAAAAADRTSAAASIGVTTAQPGRTAYGVAVEPGPSGAAHITPQYDYDLVAIGLAGLLLLLGHWPDHGVEKAGPGPRGIHSCHFDGCFRLNLLRRRGYTPAYAQLPYRRFFISNQIMADLENSSTVEAVDHGRCSTFHADKVLAPESQKNLVTAVGVVVCRHGMLMRLMNFFRGERHFYAIAAIHSLMAVGTAVHFWWYDIACRWSKSFEKWLQKQTDPAILDKGRAVVSLIPPWHRYAHSHECQKLFGHTRQAGVGRGTGEPAEVVNSVLGPHGAITRYMSPANREAHIEHVARRYCRQVLLGLPARMWRMRVRAKAVEHAMEKRVQDLEASLGEEKQQVVDEVERLIQQGREEANDVSGGASSTSRSWRAEYVRCRLVLQKLESIDEVDAEGDILPLSVLYLGAETLTVKQRPRLIRTLRAQVSQLEQSHVDLNLASFQVDSQEFQAALTELAESEITQLCNEIEGAVLDFHSLEQLVASLATRKKERDLAKKDKVKVGEELKHLFGRLKQWSLAQSAGGVLSAEQAARNTAITMDGAFKRILQQRFPWNARLKAEGMPRAVAVLLRCRHEHARCGEELRLISAEVSCACNYFRLRVHLLAAYITQVTNESERYILSKHLRFNEHMLHAFEQLLLSDAYIPEDVSYTVNEDDE
ncbi:hypothetical protein Vretimale_13302 [Volvox reticuliferus]|uniref:CxC3 like cysteine cluster domain-containing protein n=1 Tax=Volvox reticuliferus TaxID=1737510 RepID=A0A8J4GLM8_9CHLO|nr:hypothetical protein Vretifemale_14086 [Volvox reticuliferus]GIM09452.1 hypothetical protein Vretimale_13302 [Volvox reticuliferus]